jgi:hypothetical protein
MRDLEADKEVNYQQALPTNGHHRTIVRIRQGLGAQNRMFGRLSRVVDDNSASNGILCQCHTAAARSPVDQRIAGIAGPDPKGARGQDPA